MIERLLDIYSSLDERHAKKMKVLRYVISGGMATLANLLILFLLTEFMGVWYVLSAVISYLLSVVVSFSMQKYWTFRDNSSNGIGVQASVYLAVTTANVGLNALGIFLLVHYGGLHYMVSQIIVSIVIAVESYFIYHSIFRVTKPAV